MESEKKIEPKEDQLKAIDIMKKNSVGILTGGPGTGKTTTINLILKWAKDNYINVLLCAPTGKAAKRMIEATLHPARTIHSTLGGMMDNDGIFRFKYNELNPLYADLLIIDEVSMVDNNLMSHLLRAVDPEKTRILFVGDTGQLPSVGAGAVLRDLLESGHIPHIELSTIHRNTGKIVEACAKINDGEVYTPDKKIDLDVENPINLIHIECNTIERTLQAIKAIVCKRMPVRGFDPVWDVQTISPVNMRTDLSCNGINKILQNELNPLIPGHDDSYMFREKDKVINTKNIDTGETYIVNGDMGKVLYIDKNKITVEFFDPSRVVTFNKKYDSLLLAYCVTCHRMQGSEAPVVVIPVHKAFGYFTTRKWLYTAVSRAKKLCITVGNFSAIQRMIENTNDVNRHTFLKENINELFEAA